MRLVGYVRVSLVEENPENQRFSIYEWSAKNGHQIIGIFEDIGVSGVYPPLERPGFKKALEALKDCDGLVVYSLDRLSRSLYELVEIVRKIEGQGKLILSIREAWLSQLDPKIRELILAILGWAGEMEKELIKERTKEALRRLKAMGKHVGRPRKINETIVKEALRYIEKGLTLRETARLLNVGYSSLARFILETPSLRGLYYEAKARAKAKRK